ncbi:MAG: S8 family serine peptidase [Nitrospirae bacterium]|nr:S8 family serine peptidase [Nitrospirota bacterium]
MNRPTGTNAGLFKSVALPLTLAILAIMEILTFPAVGDAAAVNAPVEFVEGQVLVRFRPRVAKDVTDRTVRSRKMRVRESYGNFGNLQLLDLPPRTSVKEAVRELSADPSVEYAEPNTISYLDAYPDEQTNGRFSEQWGLENTGQAVNGTTAGVAGTDINAPAAWDVTTGAADVFVGIIDTGIDYTHPDLKDNIDSTHWINVINATSPPLDTYGHGTRMAGIIGALGNNDQPPEVNKALAGVNWKVKMIPCKGCDNGHCYLSDQLKCMDYFYGLKSNLGIDVAAVNASFGDNAYSNARYDAIKKLMEAGVVFVTAAGNGGVVAAGVGDDTDVYSYYPSGYDLPNIISAASIGNGGKLSAFSNYGARSVSVYAPGENILTTNTTSSPGGGITFGSGTSEAAAFVTGLVALIKAQDRSRGWVELKNLVLSSGRYLTDASVQVPTAGRVLTGKMIRAWDANGAGALTCSGKVVKRRLRPVSDSVNVMLGESVNISVLNINCAKPNGEITLHVSDGTTLTLKDDGKGADSFAGDGVYSVAWTPGYMGTYTVEFPYTQDDNPAFSKENLSVVVRDPSNYRLTVVPFTYSNTEDPDKLDIPYGQSVKLTSAFPIFFGNRRSGYDTLYVYGNGVISFTDSTLPQSNVPLPVRQASTIVAPLWDALNPGGASSGGGIYTEVTGVPPNRKLIIEWQGIPHAAGTGTGVGGGATFQVVFTEGSPDFLFNYVDVDFGNAAFNSGASATIGVQTKGGLARQFSYGQSALQGGGTSILFTLDDEGVYAAGIDFDGDGKEDMLWYDASTGKIDVWLMNGAKRAGGGLIDGIANPDVQIIGTGDFDGDGKTDLLLLNRTTRVVTMLLMDGNTVKRSAVVGTLQDPGVSVVATGDFDGDGKSDVLVLNLTTGEVYVVYMNGAGVKGSSLIGILPDFGWQLAGVGDFDGDGVDDLLWRNSTTGEIYVLELSASGVSVVKAAGFAGVEADLTWRTAGTCDFDGDGKRDILWRNLSTGEFKVWLMNGTNRTAEVHIGTVSDLNLQVAGVGNYRGNGKCAIVARSLFSKELSMLYINESGISSADIVQSQVDANWQSCWHGVE